MRHFRAPSEILWRNDGYKECWAPSPEAALAHFIGHGFSGGHAHLQERVNGWWRDAFPGGALGEGYRQHSYEHLWRWH